MKTIERSTLFKRDYKRIKATPHHSKNIDKLLSDTLTLLLNGETLPEKNHDHSLNGHWQGYRECHIKPDLLLIYQHIDIDTLKLFRLGSHSELFH